MKEKFGFVLLLSFALIVNPMLVRRRKLSPIIWTEHNDMFRMDEDLLQVGNSILTDQKSIIDVQLGEFLNIHCPVYDFNEKSYKNVEYHTLYMVSKEEYEDCRIQKTSPVRQILRCDKPFENVKYTFYISTFSPIPGAIEFQPGNDYYFISTSNGTLNGLNNTEYGSCQTSNMKMVIRVLASIQTKQQHSPHQVSRNRTNKVDQNSPIALTTTTTLSTTTKVTTAKRKLTSYSLVATSESLKSDGSDLIKKEKPIDQYTYVEVPFIDAQTTTIKSDIFILEPDDYSDSISQFFVSRTNKNVLNDSDKEKRVGSLKSAAGGRNSLATVLASLSLILAVVF